MREAYPDLGIVLVSILEVGLDFLHFLGDLVETLVLEQHNTLHRHSKQASPK